MVTYNRHSSTATQYLLFDALGAYQVGLGGEGLGHVGDFRQEAGRLRSYNYNHQRGVPVARYDLGPLERTSVQTDTF